ncbi:MAG: PadR family transcriptional regulator [Clostridiales bacterium]|nr:PadR family transcriptional regulator [Clostridiales bacterium]
MPRQALVVLTESMFYVLMALRQGPMCGIDAADFIDRHTAGRVAVGPATLYTILGKFVQEKWIREIEVDGRKRTYQITDKGNMAYEQEIQRLRHMLAAAERTRGGADHDR